MKNLCTLFKPMASFSTCYLGLLSWMEILLKGVKSSKPSFSFVSLFDRAPAARALFKRLNVEDFEGPEFSGHIMRVMSGLDMLINYLDNRPTLEKMLSHLSDQHIVRTGVTAAAFDVSMPIARLNQRGFLIWEQFGANWNI